MNYIFYIVLQLMPMWPVFSERVFYYCFWVCYTTIWWNACV